MTTEREAKIGAMTTEREAKIGAALQRAKVRAERAEARIAELETKLTTAREIVKRYIVAQGPHLYESWREALIKDCGLVVDEIGFVVLPKEP